MATVIVRRVSDFISEIIRDDRAGEIHGQTVWFSRRVDQSRVDSDYSLIFFYAQYLKQGDNVMLQLPVGVTRTVAPHDQSLVGNLLEDLGFLEPSLWHSDPIEQRLSNIEESIRSGIASTSIELRPGELYPE